MSPPDENHPYGHSKFEPLAAQIQSFIILFSGVFILYKAYVNITEKVEIKAVEINIAVMVISIIITSFLVIFLRRAAVKLNSTVLHADSLHYKTDILSGAGVLTALILIKITGWHLIDAIVSAVIAVYIIFSALRLSLEVTKELLDETIPDDDIKTLRDILESHKGEVVDIHNLRTRSAGNQKFIDMHLVLYHGLTLKEGNDIRTDIEKRIKSGIENADVNIYIEPCEQDSCGACAVCDGQGKDNSGSVE